MNNYILFDKFIVRTPLLNYNLNFFKTINENAVIGLLNNIKIMEAIFIASPELYKIIVEEKSTNKFSQNCIYTLLKYISRMSTRCTPFEIFAGVGLGIFSNDENQIILNKLELYKNHVQLDMNVLFSITQEINKQPLNRQFFKYYPNTSISEYSYNETLKYIEYVYKDGIRNHLLTSVTNSYYLELILNNSTKGKKIDELVNLLIEEEIEEKDAYGFINNLIDAQILISELEPYTTGIEPLEFIIEKIQNIDGLNDLYLKLVEINILLSKLSNFSSENNNINLYYKITNILQNLDIQFNSKYLFQSNLNLSLKSNVLSKKIKKNIVKAIQIVNKLTEKSSNDNLNNFRQKFYERYQDQEIPLLEILDVDNGIGYADITEKTSTPLLDGLNFSLFQNNKVLSNNELSSYFIYKLSESLLKNEKIIYLKDEELDKFDENWDDLPLTMSSIFEIYKNKDDLIYYMSGCHGSSAGNLLSRFCNSNSEINSFVRDEIIDKENSLLNENIIFAEIIHLPESRIGNILLRPQLRSYELPYLAKSNLPTDNQIYLNDILVLIKNNQVHLKSKRLNKYIIPRLTSAHNYTNPFLLSIYRFLCDLQSQNIRI